MSEPAPLTGKRIVITRAREVAGVLADALAAEGAEVVSIPTIEIRDPESWEPLDEAIRRLEEFDFLLVTSANGVRKFLERLAVCGRGLDDLLGLEIGAIGPATADEFARAGVKVDFIPREYRAEGLVEAFGDLDMSGKAFLIPRAKVARDLVPRMLAERGARVDVVEAYETVLPSIAPAELDRLLSPPPDWVTFTSSSTAANFVALLGEHRAEQLLSAAAVASIGPVTSATLRGLGVPVAVEARVSTIPGLVDAIKQYVARKRKQPATG
ncbi:MAG TPA: uroporphyrinogen-III synthase [Terriglobia bacterium]|nr:uroporphyrinogen-III synthase [Terriglobia bacterium]